MGIIWFGGTVYKIFYQNNETVYCHHSKFFEYNINFSVPKIHTFTEDDTVQNTNVIKPSEDEQNGENTPGKKTFSMIFLVWN